MAEAISYIAQSKFLSTPSARRATTTAGRKPGLFRFLSTPSARRATPSCSSLFAALLHFYPRPPRGGRPMRSIF